jgi:hypothetical protein
MPPSLDNIIDKVVKVHIQYLDVDKATILNENRFSGRVKAVDKENGISITPDEDKLATAIIPPVLEAWSINDNGDYHVDWLVFRMQTERSDGQHEWWDWQPRCTARKPPQG